jgi:predicted Zn-dependent protease
MNAMGSSSFEEMKKKTPRENDPRINAYVKCVAMAIAHEAQDGTGVRDWEVVVFRDKTANAFALPGGKIGVHTGILPVAKTPGQLAAVLGHEVGHVIARHGNERVSQNVGVGLTMAAISQAIAKPGDQKGQMIMGALGLGAQVGVLLPFSRTHESEADKIGQDLMARAGFDPAESVTLWHNMASASGGGAPPEFMSTHPSNQSRIEALEAQLPETRPVYERAKASGKNPQCGAL